MKNRLKKMQMAVFTAICFIICLLSGGCVEGEKTPEPQSPPPAVDSVVEKEEFPVETPPSAEESTPDPAPESPSVIPAPEKQEEPAPEPLPEPEQEPTVEPLPQPTPAPEESPEPLPKPENGVELPDDVW